MFRVRVISNLQSMCESNIFENNANQIKPNQVKIELNVLVVDEKTRALKEKPLGTEQITNRLKAHTEWC